MEEFRCFNRVSTSTLELFHQEHRGVKDRPLFPVPRIPLLLLPPLMKLPRCRMSRWPKAPSSSVLSKEIRSTHRCRERNSHTLQRLDLVVQKVADLQPADKSMRSFSSSLLSSFLLCIHSFIHSFIHRFHSFVIDQRPLDSHPSKIGHSITL